ncbi:MAG: hypothetical protein ACJ72W_09265, partial [Actinoallomurus sp.]
MRLTARSIAFGVAFALGVTLLPTAATAAPGTPSPDGSWSVTPVHGGYRITLHLDHQLETRDALPEIAVNGRSVGYAQQSPDGRTLTVTTTDRTAAEASSVQVAWNGVVPGAATGATPAKPAPEPHPSRTSPAVDPASPGRYAVDRADYDFGDTALKLSGLGDRVVEERAAVWVPKDAPGRPVERRDGRPQPWRRGREPCLARPAPRRGLPDHRAGADRPHGLRLPGGA